MKAAARMMTVHVGKAFEERSLAILQSRLSMSLRHVGGRGDGGVDLQGWWWVPRLPSASLQDRRRIRILAQCKAFRSKLGPVHIRELEGAALFYQRPASALDLAYTTEPTEPTEPEPEPEPEPELESDRNPSELVAMLISLSGFTSAAIRRAIASPVPFLLLHIPALKVDPNTKQPAYSQPLPKGRVSEPLGSIIWNSPLAGESGLLGGHMQVRWELGRGGRPVLYWGKHRLKHWTPEMDPDKGTSRYDRARPTLS
ncbi:Restriction endonuclease [Ceratobasidium theobromae]|uniref:Restriction endonuclease n=1 Tax=Ceratobasidium theobromae TaxID=1582974 RepID=A0A5N5QIC8_9AGAM|nr:Restriction endonuclease [Ceratobasidium theobromae]